jgi:hypothetical protein
MEIDPAVKWMLYSIESHEASSLGKRLKWSPRAYLKGYAQEEASMSIKRIQPTEQLVTPLA